MKQNPQVVALAEAIADAERFIDRAKRAMANRVVGTDWESGKKTGYDWLRGESNAATKRASMDLTRSLAKYRRGGVS